MHAWAWTAALLLGGCASSLDLNTHLSAPSQNFSTTPEQAYLGQPASQLWGLSLSGGGVRSGLYSVGALKGLHDIGLLDRIRVISSVSGGGYAAYWLFANHSADGGRFAETSLDDAHFGARLCTLTQHAALLPGIRSTIRRTLSGGLVEVYSRGIAGSFGRADLDGEPMTFTKLAKQAPTAPLWIVNATDRDQKAAAWPAQTIEFTTLGTRSETGAGSYRSWNVPAMTVRQAVSISGAIVRPLYQEYTVDGTRRTMLSDGGHTENLGTLALVRRGVGNIVVIDAEMDLAEPLGAYVRLRDGLRANGYVLIVKSLENRTTQLGDDTIMDRSVHKGWVADAETGARISTVYYVKMSRSKDAWTAIRAARAINGQPATLGQSTYQTLLANLKGRSRAPGWNCNSETYSRPLLEAMLNHATIRYADWSDTNKRARATRAVAKINKTAGQFVYFGFPRFTTFDANWEIDRSIAFAGLGYAQILEMCSDETADLCPSKPVWRSRKIGSPTR